MGRLCKPLWSAAYGKWYRLEVRASTRRTGTLYHKSCISYKRQFKRNFSLAIVPLWPLRAHPSVCRLLDDRRTEAMMSWTLV